MAAALGWLGVVGTFLAYALASRGRLSPTSVPYALLNVAGGLAGAAGCAFYGVWSSVASNLIWALMGLLTLRSRAPTHRRPPPTSCPTSSQ